MPDRATIKDFVRFYISSTDGILTLRPTKSIFDKKDTQDMFTVCNRSIKSYPRLLTENSLSGKNSSRRKKPLKI